MFAAKIYGALQSESVQNGTLGTERKKAPTREPGPKGQGHEDRTRSRPLS